MSEISIRSYQTNNQAIKKKRSSNLELYRILCMVMIVAHHYVMNSGVADASGLLHVGMNSGSSIFLSLFGAWGKTGINCFLMITGYFMCTSKITFRKFVKLMGEIYFYRWLLYAVFLVAGYETLTPVRFVKLVMPVWDLDTGFTSCFIVFWLTIPFLNILVQNINKRQHELLIMLLLVMYTFLGSIPSLNVAINYVTWFGVIFIIASYIRLYPQPIFERKSLWGWMTLVSFLLAIASVLGLRYMFGTRVGLGHNLVSDSNKFFAVAIAISSFLWFKNMNINYSKVINAFGAATFGVLLIHANSDAMRTWLWKDTVDVVGHYGSMNTGSFAFFSVGVVLAIFIICNLIDQLRIATLEKWFFNWYDQKLASKAESFVNNRILKKQ